MVWIEIKGCKGYDCKGQVTTLVVVWIEILVKSDIQQLIDVTTLVVVWIEIDYAKEISEKVLGHHSRSGVD